MTDHGGRLVLFDAYPHLYGGAQRLEHLVANALRERGWAVVAVTPGRGPFTERLVADDLAIEVVDLPRALGRYGRVTTGGRAALAALTLPWAWWRLARALRRLRPTAVHVADHRGMVLAAVPARLSGARVVWHVHALSSSRLLNRWGSRLAHRTLVPAAGALEQLPGIARDRVSVVPNPLQDVRRGPLPELGSVPVVVTVGRLHPDKGLDVLLDAFRLVRAEEPGATLQIVGGTQAGYEDLPGSLLRRADRLGIRPAVTLLGEVDDPSAVVAAGRCYVQASRTEAFGLAILEAMALGTPVAATAVGGIPDLVTDGQTGLLVEPEDPAALAGAILRLLRDDALAASLRSHAQALAADPRFGASAFVDAVAAAYEEAGRA